MSVRSNQSTKTTVVIYFIFQQIFCFDAQMHLYVQCTRSSFNNNRPKKQFLIPYIITIIYYFMPVVEQEINVTQSLSPRQKKKKNKTHASPGSQ